ncbi:MAG: mismatch repair protein MutL protein [candidate division WS6 bacterium GW2011_GWF2_39_15]|uniref:DNA mismatch repair protein MutL n=1 Tax=candidate division WS6 bacterium GW2011_GWF2_39_15 TaxID=1619100 RepID=A0A0G0MZW0_9BACT|nr:MAG: mismatch repair protein MutL protein [candidate division WS6 bacterium GW2011_GWF2_39_15]
MGNMIKDVRKLPQELINQIAAGEVIERPASIVKELVDNSIDAGAKSIKIKLEEGGTKSIEIIDDGFGISKENLSKAFEAHTTSKIETFDDLNNVITMGFRGEALSTVVSVSRVKAVSKAKSAEFGYEISFDGITPQPIQKSPKDKGTSITVTDLFYNIPARKKFLKTPETEYRKILEILYPYFMLYNNIHWTVIKNGKESLNLTPVDSAFKLSKDRIQAVLKSDFISRMFEFSSEGNGMKIAGFAGHPKDNFEKTAHQYIFINNRPIWDFGIAKSIRNAYSRFIPQTQKIPFVISIQMPTNQVDVNVHPRKEEVRFENPFRVYSLVEEAVTTALSKVVRQENQINSPYFSPSTHFNSLKDSSAKSYQPQAMFGSSGESRDIRFDKKPKDFSIKQSLEFSREIIESKNEPSSQLNTDVRNTFQIFNKYIILETQDELIIVDQHAAAERINFEKLEASIENRNMDIQNMLVPIDITLSDSEKSYLRENRDFFESLGFRFTLSDSTIGITAIPAIFTNVNIEELFRSVWDLSSEERDISKSFENAKQNILATLACHGSIRKGQPVSPAEGNQLYGDLMKCKNPYSCPHGRPAVWKLKLSEIDTNFYRTY